MDHIHCFVSAPHGSAPEKGFPEQGGLPAGAEEASGRKPGPEGKEHAQEP